MSEIEYRDYEIGLEKIAESGSFVTYNADRLHHLNSVNAILLPHGLINLSNEELLENHPLWP